MRPVSESEFRVEVDGLPVGQIIARRRSFGRVVWFWSLTGPHLPAAMEIAGSNAMTREGAKAAITSAFETWHRSTTGQPGGIRWLKSAPAAED